MNETATNTESTEVTDQKRPDAILKQIELAVQTSLERHRRFDHRGILDPEYEHTGFVNPRFQENCLLLALAGEYRIASPKGVRPSELLTISVRALDIWLRTQQRNGAIRTNVSGSDEPQATAYGLYAVARTLQLTSNQIPTIMRARAVKGLTRAARYLQHASIPAGPDSRPLRSAAIREAATWLESAPLHSVADHVRTAGERLLHEHIQRTTFPDDAGAYALALTYHALSTKKPTESDIELWRALSSRCRLSTTPTGLMGGGAESSVACLPLPTGFGIASQFVPEAREQASLLERAWAEHWYDGLLDVNVPWLTPMAYLLLEHRHAFPVPDFTSEPEPGADASLLYKNGSGLYRFGDWLARLAPGGTIGWLHHIPSKSTRVFGSPVGSALREGPWAIEGSRLRQPALTGRYEAAEGDPLTVTGNLHSTTIPGVQRTPRRVGFPMLRSRHTRDLIRLAPPQKRATMRLNKPVNYRREIELKEGALTVETFFEGRNSHRLPIIWMGGPYGEIQIGKNSMSMGLMVQERRVRELVFRGEPWPDWVVRFDRPVDILYEPVNIPVTSSPMRYLSAAAGTVDIITDDRLHMAWRVV